jgi:hypothetical protein
MFINGSNPMVGNRYENIRISREECNYYAGAISEYVKKFSKLDRLLKYFQMLQPSSFFDRNKNTLSLLIMKMSTDHSCIIQFC